MSGHGFDFKNPEKREKRTFEIPPWEQEAFEKMRAEKGEDEQRTEPVAGELEQEPQPGGEQDKSETSWSLSAPAGVDCTTEVSPDKGEDPQGAIDESVVTAMLASLAAEDKQRSDDTWKVTAVSGAILAAVGLMLFVWGVYAAINARNTTQVEFGLFGGIALMGVGVAFLVTAAYMLVKVMRDRGVL